MLLEISAMDLRKEVGYFLNEVKYSLRTTPQEVFYELRPCTGFKYDE